MNLGDLTDKDFVELEERAFNDLSLISSFVKDNWEDFSDYMIWTRHKEDEFVWCDYETDYCEHNDLKYMQYALDVYKKERL